MQYSYMRKKPYYKKLFRITIGDSLEKLAMANDDKGKL